jgi:uncharacterized protein
MAESANQNEALIRRGYELFNSGNLEALTEIIDANVVWHVQGRGRLSGDKRGRDATFGYFQQLGELTGGTFRAEVHDVIASSDHVAGAHTSTGTRNGRHLDLHNVLLFHVQNGKLVEVWEHSSDTQAFDEFWA